MDVVPERSPLLHLLTVVASFTLGPVAALKLSALTAPSSQVVQTLAPLAFLAVFAVGILVWAGLGIVAVVGRGLLQLVRGRRPGIEGAGPTTRVVPPGHRVFPVLGGAIGLGLGVLSGLLGPWGLLAACAVWMGLGLLYGTALRSAARSGYLPFPEPE